MWTAVHGGEPRPGFATLSQTGAGQGEALEVTEESAGNNGAL